MGPSLAGERLPIFLLGLPAQSSCAHTTHRANARCTLLCARPPLASRQAPRAPPGCISWQEAPRRPGAGLCTHTRWPRSVPQLQVYELSPTWKTLSHPSSPPDIPPALNSPSPSPGHGLVGPKPRFRGGPAWAWRWNQESACPPQSVPNRSFPQGGQDGRPRGRPQGVSVQTLEMTVPLPVLAQLGQSCTLLRGKAGGGPAPGPLSRSALCDFGQLWIPSVKRGHQPALPGERGHRPWEPSWGDPGTPGCPPPQLSAQRAAGWPACLKVMARSFPELKMKPGGSVLRLGRGR